jgi:GNAT superfamily N-acetyltransferase
MGGGVEVDLAARTHLVSRPYGGHDDYWRLRELLREALTANGRREVSWHVARLDYWWWFGNPFLEHLRLEDQVVLWESAEGRLVAAVNPEGPGEAHLQVHPAHRTAALDEAMVEAAEERIAVARDGGPRALRVWVDAADDLRRDVLSRRGYRRDDRPGQAEWQHRRSLDDPLPERPALADGYVVRALGDGLELLERCYASGLGFHDDDIHTARDNRDHPEWYRGIQRAPLYRRDLDLVAIAPDGSIGAFTTIWFDDVTRTAVFEPVATVPAHRRRSLARAVIVEGLHRLRAMGCLVAFVGGYSEAANALYTSVMGPDHDVAEPWHREL